MRARPRLLLLNLLFLAAAACAQPARFQQPLPIQPSREAREWAEKTLSRLTLEEKIGQMLMVRSHAEFLNIQSPDYLQLRDQVKRYGLGGLVLTVRAEGPFLYRNQPYEAATFINRMQMESKLPLLVAADFERGLSMRLHGATAFPYAMAFGAAGKAEYVADFGQIVAQESRAIGVQWNFFPVADVNSNAENPIINTRSFGEDPQQVSEFVTAYIGAARDAGMLTTVKHFPGHGDTETDTHVGFAQVTGDLDHLQHIELPPFRAAIAAGVDSVMVAHVTVPALDPDGSRVASTSPLVIQELLQDKLGFRGLIVPDAMEMNALTRLYAGHGMGRSAVEALKAGNDVILEPADLDSAYNAMLSAARSGEVPLAQIDASVRKILMAKAEAGVDRARLVDLDALPSLIATPAHVAFGQLVADAAVTLVRENDRVLPLKATGEQGTSAAPAAYQPSYQAPPQAEQHTLAVIFSDDVRTDSGRMFERQLRARIPDVNVMYVDPRIAAGMQPAVLDAVSKASTVIAAVYLIPVAGKMVRVNGAVQNSVGMADATSQLMHQILERAADHTVMVALGTPYLAASFPEVQNYLCTFSSVTVSEISAVKALFGEIPIRGHLPVTIPGVAARGTGIEKPATVPAGAAPQGGTPPDAQGR